MSQEALEVRWEQQEEWEQLEELEVDLEVNHLLPARLECPMEGSNWRRLGHQVLVQQAWVGTGSCPQPR